MAVPYILARSFEASHAFAREELGLGKGHYYVVTSPSTVKGIHGADLYLVPGWEQRYDRFAMASALRWTRLNQIDVAQMRAEAAQAPEPDGLEPAGEQPYLDGTVTEPADEPAATEEPPAEAPDKRRRRRCTDCGVLVDPDDVEQHAAEHLPTEV